MPEDVRAAISGLDAEENGDKPTVRKLRRWDKVKALELLGKHLGMWSDKVEVTGSAGAPLTVEVVCYHRQGGGA